jgi:hypothetical protein
VLAAHVICGVMVLLARAYRSPLKKPQINTDKHR